MVLVANPRIVKTARLVAELWRTARLAQATNGKSKCMNEGCDRPPEIECIWADGRGRAWFCEPHFKTWSESTDEGMPRDIVKQRKVPDGVVGEKYGEYPDKKAAHDPKVAKANFAVVAASGGLGQWPVEPLRVVTRDEALHLKYDELVLAGFGAKPEAEHFADTVRKLKIEVTRATDDTVVFEGKLLDFTAQIPKMSLQLRFVDRGRLLELFRKTESKLGNGKNALIVRRSGAANIRAAMDLHFAKVNGTKTGDGDGVGLFIPLPKNLAKKFPSLGEEDDSPSHATFLYIGDFKNKKKQEILVEKMKDICRRYWPNIKATLSSLDYFDHPDKDRRVPHVSVEFDKDMSGFRHKVKQELLEAGIEVRDSFPEYKPHVTLAYMPGMDSEWKGRIPKGSWEFDTIEIWGLPQVHKLKLGPSLKKISERWLRGQLAAASKDRDAA